MRLQLRFCHMICSILLAAVALTIPALAQQASNKSTGQPPLIDRELFFGNPEIAGAQISPAGEEAPKARNLTDLKKVTAQIYAVPKSDPDLMYVGINDRDQAWHDLYKVKISTGERTLIRKNADRFTGWVFDLKDQLRLATRSADNGDTEVLRVDGDGFKKVYSCNVFETCNPAQFHKDGKRVYMITNKGKEIDLARIVLFDPETGKEELVESDPMNRVDFGAPIFSEVTDELIATTYEDERSRIYWRDKSFESDYELLKKRLPNKDVNFGSSTKDETLWLI